MLISLIFSLLLAHQSPPAQATPDSSPAWFTQEAIEGNRVEVLEVGRKSHAARLRLIAAARQTILFSAYAIKSDSTGRAIMEALCERAKSGVDVRMLLDGFGSGPFKKLKHEVRECGIKLLFDEATHDGLRGALYALHEKLLIVDGEHLILGGTGIADYYRDAARDSKDWHDLDVEISGPLACWFHKKFGEAWLRSVSAAASQRDAFDFGSSSVPRPDASYAARLYGLTPPAECREVRYGEARFVPRYNNPWFNDDRPLLDAHIAAARSARRRIRLYAPYFVPPKALTQALLEARARGVDVTLLTNSPWSNDEMKLIPIATFKRVGRLLDAGVEIRLWKPESTMHRKGGIFDDQLAYVGSDNLDLRGQNYSSESIAFTDDAAFVARMSEEFELDLPLTIPLTRKFIQDDLKSRSVFSRLATWLMTPFL